MLRFLAGCVVLAAVCVAAVILMSMWIPGLQLPWNTNTIENPKAEKKWEGHTITSTKEATDDPAPAPSSDKDKAPAASEDMRAASVLITPEAQTTAQSRPYQDGRILVVERQDVPSERDGKLLFLGTPVKPSEFVQRSKVIEFEVPSLAVEVKGDTPEATLEAWKKVPEEERIRDVDSPNRLYRAVRPNDSLAPGTTVIVRQKMRFRKLDVGDRVVEGQTLGVINPALALDDLASKQVGVEMADAERRMAIALRDEYERRVTQIAKLRAQMKGTVSDDDYYAAKATAMRYREEEGKNIQATKKAQRELSAAVTTLKMYILKASIGGIIKAIYKQPGEAVKNLEPVLQIQNPDELRVEVQVEVQDALALRDRLDQARKLRDYARQLSQKAYERGDTTIPTAANQATDRANGLLAVEIEASRIEPPRAVLSGHLREVNCVAVTKGANPRIVSGSEDHTVRIWERIAGSERWHEKARFDHHAPVRAMACTPASVKQNLLVTATSTGRVLLFDLDTLGEKDSKDLKQVLFTNRHSGSINTVAFHHEGNVFATGGEDRAICLWDTEGKLLGRFPGAHRAGVTSLMFTPKGKLVSVGRDRRVIVWDVAEDGDSRKLTEAESFDHRANEVPQLSIDPEGKHVLFDEGRELRVLSLQTRKIVGTLANPPGAASFATLALYGPDGTTILTNGNSVGRLQLWRAPTSKVRAAEMRQFVWSSGNMNWASFDPNGQFVATGSQDSRVLVWGMPSKAEAEKPLAGELNYVEEFLDTSLRRVAVRATLKNPGWIIPGGSATIVVPPAQTK